MNTNTATNLAPTADEYQPTWHWFESPTPQRYASPIILYNGAEKWYIDVGEQHAHNGTLRRTPSGWLCVHRGGDVRTLRVLRLNDDFTPRRETKATLPIVQNDDPRIIDHAGATYLSTAYWWNHWSGFRMELRRVINADAGNIELVDVAKFEHIDNWPGYIKPAFEKNWAPFSHDGRLLYVYSVSPHRILEFNPNTGKVALIHETDPCVRWSIAGASESRLNAPPVLLADGTYLSTFHVRDAKGYYTGFYRFEACPPFNIIEVSAEPYLLPEDSDGTSWRNQNLQVLFIQGMDVADNVLTLFGGDNDHSVIAVRCDLRRVLNSLVMV
jgi:hypothetical protein